MLLGEKLINLRKKSGFSQEEVAKKLGISRQTISKWETNQTAPDFSKAKLLSKFYNVSISYFLDNSELMYYATNIEAISDEIDWTKAWSKKYPILVSYHGIEQIEKYEQKIFDLFDFFKEEYKMNSTDTVLILKDILYQKYKIEKNKENLNK